METAARGKAPEAFFEPEGIVRLEVCAESGLLPNPDCPNRRIEVFVVGTEPSETCTWHRAIRVDIDTGQLATDACPTGRVHTRVALFWPPEALGWALESGRYVPPVEMCALHSASGGSPPTVASSSARLVLTSPDPNGIYRISPLLPRDVQALELGARWLGSEELASVEFYVDGDLAGEALVAPHRVSWRLESGVHTLRAVGVTQSGARVESAVLRFDVLE
jgi:hypothetical protein